MWFLKVLDKLAQRQKFYRAPAAYMMGYIQVIHSRLIVLDEKG